MTSTVAAKSKREVLERQYSSVVDCLSAFDAEVPTEGCARTLVFGGLISDAGIECANCAVVGMPDAERSFTCRSCKRIVWVTAHSFFENVRRMRPWLALIWLMERGVPFNPHQVHSLIHVSSSTAAEIKRKLDCLVSDQMPTEAPTVPSGFFTDLFCRRTIETPARAHPREEQSVLDRKADLVDSAPDMVLLTDPDDPFSGPLNECEQAVWDCLSDEPIDFDRLVYRSNMSESMLNAGICLLKLRGLIKASSGTYTRVPKSSRHKVDVNKVPADQFKKFVQTVHQGIGRRALQWYLAAFWCFMDRKRWGPGALLAVCLKSSPVSCERLRMYVSPQFVKMMP